MAKPDALAAEPRTPINEKPVTPAICRRSSEIEHAIETPEAPPSLVGRYSAGGANYMIFADGSIEAETAEGAFKFASMGDFKRYLADARPTRRTPLTRIAPRALTQTVGS